MTTDEALQHIIEQLQDIRAAGEYVWKTGDKSAGRDIMAIADDILKALGGDEALADTMDGGLLTNPGEWFEPPPGELRTRRPPFVDGFDMTKNQYDELTSPDIEKINRRSGWKNFDPHRKIDSLTNEEIETLRERASDGTFDDLYTGTVKPGNVVEYPLKGRMEVKEGEVIFREIEDES